MSKTSNSIMEGEMPDSIFLSYSHDDAQWKTAILKHLTPWKIAIWNDSDIEIGSRWLERINVALGSCSAALLLLSSSYLSSEFITQNELPLILGAVQSRGLRLICIHVSANSFEATCLSDYQSANNPAQPLNTLAPGEVDVELKRISIAIASIMKGPPKVQSVPPGSATTLSKPPRADNAVTRMNVDARKIEGKHVSVVNLDGTNQPNNSAETRITSETIKGDVVEFINQRNKKT